MARFLLRFLVQEVRAVRLYLVACHLGWEFFASSSFVGVLGSSFAPFVEASFVFDLVSSGPLVAASFVFDLGPSFGLLVVASFVSASDQLVSVAGLEVSLASQNSVLLVS